MAEAIAADTLLQTSVEEADADGERCREVILDWVENAVALCAEATECDAETEAEVISRRLGVDFLDVGRKGIAFETIDGELGPLLGMSPWGGAGKHEFDGGFAVGFAVSECSVQRILDCFSG